MYFLKAIAAAGSAMLISINELGLPILSPYKEWITVAISILGVIVVYAAPNKPPPIRPGRHEAL